MARAPRQWLSSGWLDNEGNSPERKSSRLRVVLALWVMSCFGGFGLRNDSVIAWQCEGKVGYKSHIYYGSVLANGDIGWEGGDGIGCRMEEWWRDGEHG